MIELNEKASIYAEENVINVLKEAFAKVYADGYRDGYKDCQNEIPVELRSNQTEFVDLGLPSGTLWSGEYEKEKDSLRYAPFDKAMTMMIPTKEQCEELLSYCKWECVRKNGIYDHLDCIGPNGNIISFFPHGYISSDSCYMEFKVLIWIQDNVQKSEISVLEMDSSYRLIGSLFSGYKLPIRLVSTNK